MGYEILWESQGGVVKRFFGKVCTGDFVNAVLSTEADGRFRNLRYVLNDYLGIKELSFDRADVNFISALYSATALSNPRFKIAFVTRNPKIIALANEYANSPLNAYPAKTFSTLTDARNWLETNDSPRDSRQADSQSQDQERAHDFKNLTTE